ncbi:hypothetical protein JCM11251_007366 [Rhodosporidiobolus azoricus]
MRFALSFLATLSFIAGSALAAKRSLDIDFSTYNGSPTDSAEAAKWLNSKGLWVSDWPIDSTPLPHTYLVDNVNIENGSLVLKVPAVAADGEVTGAEVATIDDQILYGTFTTWAKASPVPGVCHGFFTYTDENHEIDIELLTSYYSKGYRYSVKKGLQLTNQPLEPGTGSTNSVWEYTFDPTDAYHEYTIGWSASASKFYVDGNLVETFTTNVPRVAAQFIWNSWSSGDPNWSAGPPKKDAYLSIRRVHLEYSTA